MKLISFTVISILFFVPVISAQVAAPFSFICPDGNETKFEKKEIAVYLQSGEWKIVRITGLHVYLDG
jgi:hypothetical protein